MKTEIRMLPNGNCESVVLPIQHRCYGSSGEYCTEYAARLGRLMLTITEGDPYEDGCEHEIQVNFCPFCGCKAEIPREGKE